jgi:hypothetical protein
MLFNFFKKKPTGWEIPDLMGSLQRELADRQGTLKAYANGNPLAALSEDNRHFVVIRDFDFHDRQGKIDLLNARPEAGQGHKGMTLVNCGPNGGASAINVLLPAELQYTKVALEGPVIHIYHGKEKATTNFQEINRLWAIEPLTEAEILQLFRSLENKVEEQPVAKAPAISEIATAFFGTLVFDSLLDCYCGAITYNGLPLEVSFANMDKVQLDDCLLAAEQLLAKTMQIRQEMAKDMLDLKNDAWLDEGQTELTPEAFDQAIQLHSIYTYEDKTMDFYYTAGDLFWGHHILTTVDADGQYIESDLAG